MSAQLRRVAVDLTSVLPGGANGGAKVFALQLLQDLFRLAPTCEFVLLTSAAAHSELALLEKTNVRRVLMPDTQSRKLLLPRRSLGRISRRLPRRAKAFASQIHIASPAQTARRLVAELGHDLLFCPFTAPTYHDPAKPTICVIYDLQHKTYPQFFTHDDLKYRDQAFADAIRYGSFLTAISEYSRESALSYGEIEPHRIASIPLRMAQRLEAIGVERCQEVLSAFGLDYQRYLLYPANFWQHKNHELLLESFRIARDAGLPNDMKLVLTGNADKRQETVRNLMRYLDLEERVVIPGYLNKGQFEAILNGCVGVIFPSLFEGFGLPVIEAMAVGKPVACSRVTSLPEVVGDAALMFDPRNAQEIAAAMIKLTSDQPLRETLIAAGFKRAGNFEDSMQTAREYWTLFERALHTRH